MLVRVKIFGIPLNIAVTRSVAATSICAKEINQIRYTREIKVPS